jgi:hypothetical protein
MEALSLDHIQESEFDSAHTRRLTTLGILHNSIEARSINPFMSISLRALRKLYRLNRLYFEGKSACNAKQQEQSTVLGMLTGRIRFALQERAVYARVMNSDELNHSALGDFRVSMCDLDELDHDVNDHLRIIELLNQEKKLIDAMLKSCSSARPEDVPPRIAAAIEEAKQELDGAVDAVGNCIRQHGTLV